MLGGHTIGAYSLSEPHAGSDVAALTCRAERTTDGYRVTGTKAWITHGSRADVYILFARTGTPDSGGRGISCFLVPAATEGLSFGQPEKKMAMASANPTAQAIERSVARSAT